MSAEAARIAREAAAVIEQCGHTKQALVGDDNSVCMWGALRQAANGTDKVFYPYRNAEAYEELWLFFTRKFGESQSWSFPGASEFNDLPETTGKDVQKFLLSAADEIEFL